MTYLQDGAGSGYFARVDQSGALLVAVGGADIIVETTGSNSLFDPSGVQLYFTNGRIAISGVSMPTIVQTGSVAITSSTTLTQTGSVAITSSATLSIAGSVALNPYNAWAGIGSALITNPGAFTGSVAVTSGFLTGSVNVATPITQTGSVAITSSAILGISGNAVTIVLTTGSMVPQNFTSGVWNFTTTIANTRAWAVSTSGGATQFDISPGSTQTMVYHTNPSTVSLFSEDTSPSFIAVRTAVTISGTVEMWAP